jgi:hypothetical protein
VVASAHVLGGQASKWSSTMQHSTQACGQLSMALAPRPDEMPREVPKAREALMQVQGCTLWILWLVHYCIRWVQCCPPHGS